MPALGGPSFVWARNGKLPKSPKNAFAPWPRRSAALKRPLDFENTAMLRRQILPHHGFMKNA